MCIIAVKPAASAAPNEARLRYMFNTNKDGAGIAWARDGVLHIVKGLMTADEFIKAAQRVPEDAAAVYHCRITTSGGTCKELTHPFVLDASIKRQRQTRVETSSGAAVAHNGVFSEFRHKELNNDTTQFITNYLAPLNALKKQTGGEITDADLRNIIDELTTGSRLAIITNSGALEVYGSGWITDGGIKYSNYNYKPYESDYLQRDGWRAYYSEWNSKAFKDYCELNKDSGFSKHDLYDLFLYGGCDGY